MAAAGIHQNGLDDSSKPAPTQPVVARMYDWYLGGTHSYAIDRQAAEEVERFLPDIKPTVVENRAFLRRAVRWLAKNGVTQFIDIGSGLPTAGNTHETVLKMEPRARILYVDIEDNVVKEGNEFIEKTGWQKQVAMIKTSALKPEGIFEDLVAQRIIDFNKPVAVMIIALIHFFHPPQYTSVLAFWKTKLVKGSASVMTHATTDDRDPIELARTKDMYDKTPTPLFFRSREEIEPILDG